MTDDRTQDEQTAAQEMPPRCDSSNVPPSPDESSLADSRTSALCTSEAEHVEAATSTDATVTLGRCDSAVSQASVALYKYASRWKIGGVPSSRVRALARFFRKGRDARSLYSESEAVEVIEGPNAGDCGEECGDDWIDEKTVGAEIV